VSFHTPRVSKKTSKAQSTARKGKKKVPKKKKEERSTNCKKDVLAAVWRESALMAEMTTQARRSLEKGRKMLSWKREGEGLRAKSVSFTSSIHHTKRGRIRGETRTGKPAQKIGLKKKDAGKNFEKQVGGPSGRDRGRSAKEK